VIGRKKQRQTSNRVKGFASRGGESRIGYPATRIQIEDRADFAQLLRGRWSSLFANGEGEALGENRFCRDEQAEEKSGEEAAEVS